MADPNILYKLMILQLLSDSGSDITGTLMADFFLEYNYTNYFTLEQALSELSDKGLIRSEDVHSNTIYSITPSGLETLSYFPDRISPAVKKDITDFLKKKEIDIKEATILLANHYRNTNGGYDVRLRIRENNQNTVDLTVVVRSEDAARSICANWKNKGSDVYNYLMNLLIE